MISDLLNSLMKNKKPAFDGFFGKHQLGAGFGIITYT